MSRTNSHIIILNFISGSDWLIQNLKQHFTHYKVERVGTLIKTMIHKLMEHVENKHNLKNKRKITNFQTQEIPHNTCHIFVRIYNFLYFLHRYFDSYTTSKYNFIFWKMYVIINQFCTPKFKIHLFMEFILFAFETHQWPECGRLGRKGLTMHTSQRPSTFYTVAECSPAKAPLLFIFLTSLSCSTVNVSRQNHELTSHYSMFWLWFVFEAR